MSVVSSSVAMYGVCEVQMHSATSLTHAAGIPGVQSVAGPCHTRFYRPRFEDRVPQPDYLYVVVVGVISGNLTACTDPHAVAARGSLAGSALHAKANGGVELAFAPPGIYGSSQAGAEGP